MRITCFVNMRTEKSFQKGKKILVFTPGFVSRFYGPLFLKSFGLKKMFKVIKVFKKVLKCLKYLTMW